jgi:hypothetical protein
VPKESVGGGSLVWYYIVAGDIGLLVVEEMKFFLCLQLTRITTKLSH